MASRWVMLAAAAVLVGCGSGGGGGSSDGGAPPVFNPPPVTLLSITVLPAAASLLEDDTVALTVSGSYSDGTVVPVNASWVSGNLSVATMNTASGSNIIVTGKGDGVVNIEATFGGKKAACTVTVQTIPDDPGAVYGLDNSDLATGTVLSYPTDGAGPAVLATVPGWVSGFCLNRAKDRLYAISDGPAGKALYGIELDGTVSLLADYPYETYDRPISCHTDSQDRVYTPCYGSGQLVRYDPADGSVATVGTGAAGNTSTSFGADDAPYYGAIMGASWIRRHNLATDAVTTWGTAGPEAGTNSYGFIISGGLAINRKGEAFMGDTCMTYVWKYADLNGDGDALDAGERTVFADLEGDGLFATIGLWGITEAPGNTVVVNVQTSTAPPGLYWLADRNKDGDALDAGEATLYNSTPVINDLDAGCLAASRR